MTTRARSWLLGILVAMVVAGVALLTSNDQPSSQPSTAAPALTHGGAPIVLGAVQHAARRFLEGYLPLIYGQRGASATKLHSAAPQLIAELLAEPGRIPPAQSTLQPRVQSISIVVESPTTARASAQITDSATPAWTLTLQLHDSGARWLVSRLGQ